MRSRPSKAARRLARMAASRTPRQCALHQIAAERRAQLLTLLPNHPFPPRRAPLAIELRGNKVTALRALNLHGLAAKVLP